MNRESDVSRRRMLFGSAGGLAAGALATGAAWGATAHHQDRSASDADLVDLTRSYPYYDQSVPAGIQTPPQRYAMFMTFDMADGTLASDLQTLLARWSAASSQLMAGQPVGQVQPASADGVPADTGEASGLPPAGLTVTIGLGPSLFDRRFGLASRRPKALRPLPALPSDNLAKATSGGDLSIQACSDDPQVCYHAVRNLARMARGTVQTRWTVSGFGRASAGKGQQTPRNLMGFKDGTRNIVEDPDFSRYVWVTEPGWMQGGTYQVVRKIEMDIEIWDADRVGHQEQVFGRTKAEGAPLTGHGEFDTPDFAAHSGGKPTIDPNSHVALAAPENNGGVHILRRGYNFTEGINTDGQLNAGLLFISYQNDPDHFVRLQRRLGASDLLNEYIKHVGSGVFAVPAAPRTGHYVGEQLFG